MRKVDLMNKGLRRIMLIDSPDAYIDIVGIEDLMNKGFETDRRQSSVDRRKTEKDELAADCGQWTTDGFLEKT
ncbi:MAG: hypothetical protein WCE90_06610 [Candidatus Zixiibacteriota bacterium]